MKPLKTTSEVDARVLREAELRSQHTPYKELSAETGLSPGYLATRIGRLARALREKVKIRNRSC